MKKSKSATQQLYEAVGGKSWSDMPAVCRRWYRSVLRHARRLCSGPSLGDLRHELEAGGWHVHKDSDIWFLIREAYRKAAAHAAKGKGRKASK